MGSQLGVAVEDYRGDTARVAEHDTGILELDVDPDVLDHLHRDGKVQIDAEVADLPEPLWPNACLVLRAGPSTSGPNAITRPAGPSAWTTSSGRPP